MVEAAIANERQSRRDGLSALRPAPIFVLVAPQMGENIGAAARAMLNFGVSALRLVAPRDGWPNPKAGAMAAGASLVIDQAQVFDTLAEAIADCTLVLATTARSRDILLPVHDPAGAAALIAPRIEAGEKCAVLFGAERSGLSNEDVMRADGIISVPVNPAFASLNLAQAALIMAYEWGRIDGRTSFDSALAETQAAAKDDLERFHQHMEDELDAAGYFHPPEKKSVMSRNLRAAFTRANFTDGELQTLRGVVKALAKGRGRFAEKKRDI
ncbi:MAG: RNA methyltransferase [Pseudomonadota bacterium]